MHLKYDTLGRIVVTGSTGLVGSYVLLELAKRKQQVVAMYRSEKKRALVEAWIQERAENSNTAISWKRIDLLDSLAVQQAFQDRDAVVHCAAEVSYRRNQQAALLENVTMTTLLCNTLALKEGAFLVHMSSTAAVDRSTEGGKIHEEMHIEDTAHLSPYALSKHYSEREVWRAFSEGLQGCIFNPTVVIGYLPWCNSSGSMFEYVQSQKSYVPVGSTAFIDVRDVATAVVSALGSRPSQERFLLYGSHASYKEVLHAMARRLDKAPPSKPLTSAYRPLIWIADLCERLGCFVGVNALLYQKTAEHHVYESKKQDVFFPEGHLSFEESIAHHSALFQAFMKTL